MSKNTKMLRVHSDLDRLLNDMSRNMKITKTDASRMVAVQLSTPRVIVKKKGRKYLVGRSLVSL